MEYNCQILEQPSQHVLVIPAKTPQNKLKNVQKNAFKTIESYLVSLDKESSGAPFTAFFDMDINNLDIEVGYPVECELDGQNEVSASEIPMGKYVTCIFNGPYDKIEGAYESLMIYANENGYETAGTCYEFYLNNNFIQSENMEIKVMLPLKLKK